MSDAQVKLDSMVVGDRVTAVAEDVQSRRDAYRSIKSWVLADLLGVPNPEHPDGSWNFKFIVARIPLIEEISNIDLEGFRVLVEACLPIERCDAIIEQIARFGPYSDLNDSDITFITPAERELIEFESMTRRGKDSAYRKIALYKLKSNLGLELYFEAHLDE